MTGAPTFEQHVRTHNLRGARLAAMLVFVLMPAGALLDWATNPAHLQQFLELRLASSLVVTGVLALTYTRWATRFDYLLGVAPGFIGAVFIQAMIQQLEGYASPYYAGLNLCILGVGIVFTWTMLQTGIACLSIIAVWLAPTLLSPDPIQFGPFFNNLYFLVLTSVIAVSSNELRYRQTKREFDAQQAEARTSAKLRDALARLRELDRAKSEFFANISHELRTPLALILTPVEERLDRHLDENDRRIFEVVRRNAVRLLRLIDDLLDLSRIDAGRLRLRVESIDLQILVEQVVDSFRPTAAARGLELDLDLGRMPGDLHGDPHRIEMVLTNLLGNALKFTPEGGRIRILAGARRGRTVIEVEDTGPGIPEAELERIFERFHQVEGSARRTKEGAGIGLALARELVELHGGELQVESQVGQGSLFRVVLPLGREHFRPEVIERRKVSLEVPMGRRATDLVPAGSDAIVPMPRIPAPAVARAEAQVRLEGGRRPRVLIAEDNADLRDFLASLLAEDYEVEVAVDGREALEKMMAEPADLVLSDVMMPHTTGIDLCAAIKSEEKLRNTPVILLTARSGSDSVLEGYSSGADDFVSKPVHPRVLLARIRAQLRLRSLSLQLAQQERLAAVGTLAAGIGHEVRNPINAVLNGARALLANPRVDTATRRVLEVIEEAGNRVEGISAALLDHAHPGEQDRPRPCDVRAGLDATLRLLEHRTRNVQIHRSYDSDQHVVASAAELNQVFLNLLDNSIRSSAANVWIRVESKDDTVKVSIADDGPGVPREIAQRIFDPFFTTRDTGEGTGLGLYLSRRIVHGYGGRLELGARPGGGAVFTVELPAEETK